jgi:Ion channel
MQPTNFRRAPSRKLPLRVRPGEVGRHFSRAREKLGDRLLTWLTLLLVFLTFGVIPLHASGLVVFEGYALATVLVMAGCVLGTSAGTGAISAILTGVALAAAGSVARFMGHQEHGLYLDAAAWVTVASALAYVVARAVFGPGEVTYHRVVGAVLLYLTMGNIFVGLYGVMCLLAPGATAGIDAPGRPKFASDLIYFSFTTLTTVGYGDIVPVHPVARSLSNLEAIFGQIFPATLLARLVTLELENRRR